MRMPMYVDIIGNLMAYKKNGSVNTLSYNRYIAEHLVKNNQVITLGIWANHLNFQGVTNLYPKCTFSSVGMGSLSIEQKVEIIDRLGNRNAEDESK